MTYTLLDIAALDHDGDTAEFQGVQHGGARVSIILVDVPPGGGPKLHRHPYEEVFIVQEGRASYTVGTETLDAHAGQMVIVPAGTPHKFTNSGDCPLRQVDIHVSERFITEWLEE